MNNSERIPLHEYEPRRVALIKPSALGDIIHTLPVLTALRQRYPYAHITWVVNRAYEPLLRDHPDLSAVLPFDRHTVRHGWLSALSYGSEFLRKLRDQHFDLVLDLQNLLRSGIMTFATGAARRVGLETSREGARWFYTDVVAVPNRDALHAIDRYWLAAKALGAGDGPKTARLPIPNDDLSWADRVLGPLPRPWMMLGVGARWTTKRWPAEHFAALARRAQQHFGGTVVFVGSRDETAAARLVANALSGPSLVLTDQTTLPQLAAILFNADVMVANDTGPLHLATALGRPVVAPYTCTKVRRTGPYGWESKAVEARIWCQGSYLKRCARMECMAALTPDHLWPALYEVLLGWDTHRRSA